MHSITEMWTLRGKKKITVKFLETESRKAVASGWGEKIQTFTYRVNVI